VIIPVLVPHYIDSHEGIGEYLSIDHEPAIFITALLHVVIRKVYDTELPA
jgi:hypothetical protein